jgi:DNA-binding beta-propeller fold protein YncE
VYRIYNVSSVIIFAAFLSVNLARPAIAQTDRVLTTLGGTGSSGFSGDGGSATSAQLNPESECFRVGVGPNGDIYVADVSNNRIRKITIADGNISTIAGNGTAGFSGDGGAATSAELNRPTNVVFDNNGNMYVLDSGNNRVRKIVLVRGSSAQLVIRPRVRSQIRAV